MEVVNVHVHHGFSDTWIVMQVAHQNYLYMYTCIPKSLRVFFPFSVVPKPIHDIVLHSVIVLDRVV